MPSAVFAAGAGVPGRYSHILIDGPKTRFAIVFTVPANDTASAKVFEDVLKSFTVIPAK